MSLTIATWNVNSIKARLSIVLDWLGNVRPDIVLLQELKTSEDGFPRLEIEAIGYRAEVLGQKSYNGVAILSRYPLADVTRGLPGDPDDAQARYIEATVQPDGARPVRVACLYLPNGNPIPGDKFDYKLAWMDRLCSHAETVLDRDDSVVLGGDYNVIPSDGDVYDPAAFANDALAQPETRQRYRALLHQGWTDAVAARHPGPGHYTYWDYQAGAWQRDFGLRIDHLLLSPAAADRLDEVWIDRAPRGREKASDHTPVLCRLLP